MLNNDNLLMVEKVKIIADKIENYFDYINNELQLYEQDLLYIISVFDFDIERGHKITVGDKHVFFTEHNFEVFLEQNPYITDNDLEKIYKETKCYYVNIINHETDAETNLEIKEEAYNFLTKQKDILQKQLEEINNYYQWSNSNGYYLSMEYDIKTQIDELYNTNDKYRKEVDSFELQKKLENDLKKNNLQKRLKKVWQSKNKYYIKYITTKIIGGIVMKIKNLMELEKAFDKEIRSKLELAVSKYIRVNKIEIKESYKNRQELSFIEDGTKEFVNERLQTIIIDFVSTQVDLKELYKNSNKLNEIKSIHDLAYDKNLGKRAKLYDYLSGRFIELLPSYKQKMYNYFDILQDKLEADIINNNTATRKMKI